MLGESAGWADRSFWRRVLRFSPYGSIMSRRRSPDSSWITAYTSTTFPNSSFGVELSRCSAEKLASGDFRPLGRKPHTIDSGVLSARLFAGESVTVNRSQEPYPAACTITDLREARGT
jgi:hypothetical protein